MTRVIDNWERLVKATLLRQQLRITGISHERKSSGLASAVPDSLQRTTYINAILQAADEIQPEDDPVARILCEQAYSMTRNLDPNSEGRGVFQFKAGLMAVIKQKLAKKDGRTIDRNWDAQHLWNFYQHYKRKHRVNEIQKEEPKMPESGTFSADMGLRSQETKKVFTTLRALVEVLEVLIKEGPPDGVGKYLAEEVLFEIKMTKVFDNWERLVRGALRREQLRLTRKTHELATSINVMLQGADEIQSEDAQVARILCEQAYTMAQRLDPSSEGRGALQFNAGISTVIKQKLAKMDGRTIDRHGDVQRLWNFYQHYKRKHKVDEIQKEEQKMLESGTSSADMGLRSQETKKVFTTLRALVEAMENLIKEEPPDGVARYIAEEVLFEIKMKKVFDNWERLVRGALRREQLWLTRKSHERATSINVMLQGADEIQSEDANVARILCETAYTIVQNLDPNSEGIGALQFNTGLTTVIKQKLARKDGRIIDRKCDAQNLWNFYQHYKRKHRVDEIQKEEQKLLESGTFSADMGLRSQETKKVFTTLRALVEVMEVLVEEAAPDGVGREIAEELKRLKLEDGNKTDGQEVKLEDVDKQGKEKGSTSRPKEWQYLEISLEEIKQAAKNFQDCIGKGGYGLVYKGELYRSGKPIPVAIKRLNEQFGQGLKEFLTEIQLLFGKKHPNLISLIGYCEEDKEKILVYEYAQHGSLDQYLRRDNPTNYTLTWHQRLKICAGAARGLDHLHHHFGKHIRIIHRDIKSANILLDENWVAKISDFGLSKLSLAGLDRSTVISHPCGTMGYCEPEYMITGILSKESDVYSFGIVLFEVLCRRLCIIKDNDGVLLSGPLAKEFYERKRLEEIIDPSLKEHFSSESVNKFSEIAYRCLHYDRKQRPPMDLVAKELEDLLEMEV